MALFLTWESGHVPEEGYVVTSSLSALTLSYRKEPAGHLYHLFALKQTGLHEESEEEDTAADDEAGAKSRSSSVNDFSSLDEEATSGTKWKGKGKKKGKKKGHGDLYALLGLQNERWMATPDQIRLAYRKSALLHHPDKQGIPSGDEVGKQEAEDKFKAIQEAYETLFDPAKRREFDSLDEFDDSLPGEVESAEAFYTVYGQAFSRNSRWAVHQPAPTLGDDTSSYEEVDKFYDFWYGFKSWREFPHPDEEDIEQAEGREHKRWIERINAKLREKGTKAEARRIRELAEKKATQKERAALRRVWAAQTDLHAAVDEDAVEQLCAGLALAQLRDLNAELSRVGAELEERLAALDARLATVRLLQKALDKWPAGTAKRWEVVQGYVRTRTTDEILDMVKHGLKAHAARAVPQTYEVAAKRQGNTVIRSEATERHTSFTDVDVPAVNGSKPGTASPEAAAPVQWTEAQELALIKALKVVRKEVPDRWEVVSSLVPGRTKADCFTRFKQMKAAHKAKTGK
ncbi:DnaJ-like protein subfamily C member 2 [Auxenochlorella protothecoides]|uniref:DnaJ-like protein subfamily C member 2 n=1 Tax=Auxenochlorella protothecoides TaxID=3075 RepID=A0A087SQF6_AUXPR|nr:DnaJ-like protein subfamily C member 2 [Auxenochlorella protothecoides]KFM27960.1 DnaJ-like protein subfamily C member 2 [Auxenochlorella protothecoides]